MSEDKITNDDIAALPQAAQGEIDRVNRVNAEKAATAPAPDKTPAREAFDQEFQENGATLVQEGISQAYVAAFSEPITKEQSWAMSKASGMLFSLLRKLPGGGIIGGGVIVVCLFLPFLPTVLKKMQAAKQPQKQEQQNG